MWVGRAQGPTLHTPRTLHWPTSFISDFALTHILHLRLMLALLASFLSLPFITSLPSPGLNLFPFPQSFQSSNSPNPSNPPIPPILPILQFLQAFLYLSLEQDPRHLSFFPFSFFLFLLSPLAFSRHLSHHITPFGRLSCTRPRDSCRWARAIIIYKHRLSSNRGCDLGEENEA